MNIGLNMMIYLKHHLNKTLMTFMKVTGFIIHLIMQIIMETETITKMENMSVTPLIGDPAIQKIQDGCSMSRYKKLLESIGEEE